MKTDLNRMRRCILITTLLLTTFGLSVVFVPGQDLGFIRNSTGLRLLVDERNSAPTIRVMLPDRPVDERTIEILFPEHVTVRKSGSAAVEHLYFWRPGSQVKRPIWRRVENSFEYEQELPGRLYLVARSTLESDGVRFRYEFRNGSTANYDLINAVTDPRMTSVLHDERLERTYVHYPAGFELLAKETPARLTMPLRDWLPARYLASFTWPIPAERIERRGDGITYYHTSRAVDQPFIATISTDRKWIVASFTRTTGNVWSNPKLTCQHVDPQIKLGPGQVGVIEIKILITHGSLRDAFRKAVKQRARLA